MLSINTHNKWYTQQNIYFNTTILQEANCCYLKYYVVKYINSIWNCKQFKDEHFIFEMSSSKSILYFWNTVYALFLDCKSKHFMFVVWLHFK